MPSNLLSKQIQFHGVKGFHVDENQHFGTISPQRAIDINPLGISADTHFPKWMLKVARDIWGRLKKSSSGQTRLGTNQLSPTYLTRPRSHVQCFHSSDVEEPAVSLDPMGTATAKGGHRKQGGGSAGHSGHTGQGGDVFGLHAPCLELMHLVVTAAFP